MRILIIQLRQNWTGLLSALVRIDLQNTLRTACPLSERVILCQNNCVTDNFFIKNGIYISFYILYYDICIDITNIFTILLV